MTDWFTGKVAYQSTRLGFTVGARLAKSFPRGAIWFADRLAGVSFYLFRGFRQRSVRNIQVAFGDRIDGPEVSRIARQSLRSFFRACVEMAALMDASDQEISAKIVVDGREHLHAALEKGNGVLVLSAHLGNFILLGTRLAVEGFPTHVLVNQPRDGQFGLLMDNYRLQIRQTTIHARPRQEALNELKAVLRRNQIAVVIADEYRKGSGVQVSLFGRTVIARRGPATLALRTGAAVVPVYVVRQADEMLRLIIEPELELVRSGKGRAEIQENAIRMTNWLERTVRQYPDQWNWSNIRWWVSPNRASITESRQL